jgi:hypothetical protein
MLSTKMLTAKIPMTSVVSTPATLRTTRRRFQRLFCGS